MVIWAAHLLLPVRDSAATRRIREPGRLASGEPLSYGWGLGLGSYRGRATLRHGGSGVATETYFEVFPELGFAVAAASASPGILDPARAAHLAADRFLAGELEPVAPPAPGPRMMLLTDSMISTPPPESAGVEVAEERLRACAGTYRFPDGGVLVVRARGGRLEYARDGAPPFIPLFPVPDGAFVMMPLRERYAFQTDPGGGALRLVVESARPEREAERSIGVRLPERRLDAGSAAAYLGWYVSGELDAVYEVALGPDGLELRHARHGRMPLIPLASEDDFGVDARLIVGAAFKRGPDGAVLGMELRALSWDARAFFRKVVGLAR